MTYAESDLVKRHRGTMPIIMTCPHDGSETPSDVRERTEANSPAGCDFNSNRDVQTAAITEGVARAILAATGLSPYAVIARFSRRYIDANRPAGCAFVDNDGRRFYDGYHDRILEFVDEVLEENGGKGFLFDIHGTGVIESDPADVYLGTADGASLQPDFDRGSLFRRHGLRGLLAAARHDPGLLGGPAFRFTVSPSNASVTETSAVNGGHTVRRYSPAVNCIQIEIARPIRDDGVKRQFLIDDLAAALVNSVRRRAPF